MPRCPECGREFEEGNEVCPGCKVKPVSEFKEGNGYGHEALLTTVSDDIEANLVISLLESNYIPAMKKAFLCNV